MINNVGPAHRALDRITRITPTRRVSADSLQAMAGAPDRPILFSLSNLSAADHRPGVRRNWIHQCDVPGVRLPDSAGESGARSDAGLGETAAPAVVLAAGLGAVMQRQPVDDEG